MNRTNRFAVLATAVLLLVAAGIVMASRNPVARDQPAAPASSHEPEVQAESEDEAPPTAEELARVGDRLDASEIPFDEAALTDLAARYGVGGAVRLLAWSEEAQMDVEALAAMHDGTDAEPGMGWGRIAKELDLHPGIGSIMGNGNGNGNGNGHGRENAPGQQNKKAPEE
ncbi:MAG: hypothetical protein ABIZ57_01665 [Candidatus Limnocylindria bacterium]